MPKLKNARKEKSRSEDEILLARLVRSMRLGDSIQQGACRGCGSPGERALAEYEMQGRTSRVEVCFLCTDCRNRCGGMRLRFKLDYKPIWKENDCDSAGNQG